MMGERSVPSTELKLLYLGFAFPPGIAALFPGVNPAGHALETQMLGELRRHFEIRSAGVLPFYPPAVRPADPASGVAHDLLLLEKAPELFHRLNSLARLKKQYLCWQRSGWEPDMVLVYNLSPIYNQFVLWLRRQSYRPRLMLLLLDSPNLGQKTSWFKQVRRRLKPMFIPDSKMIQRFDGCIGLSQSVERYFRPSNVPFLWMPGGCSPGRAIRNGEFAHDEASNSALRLGYFGALGAHAGIKPLIETFLATNLAATLEVCGYGKMGEHLTDLAYRDTRLRYHGLLSPSECLHFGRSCDVLVNPRPASHGNENNFASKLFEYGLSGRAILTSRLSGVEAVLGPEAFYFDAHDFSRSLEQKLLDLARVPKAELHRRGAAIQERIIARFSWSVQGARLSRFIREVCCEKVVPGESLAALAA